METAAHALEDIVLGVPQVRGSGDSHVGRMSHVAPVNGEWNHTSSDVVLTDLVPKPNHHPDHDGVGQGAGETVVHQNPEDAQRPTELKEKNIQIEEIGFFFNRSH